MSELKNEMIAKFFYLQNEAIFIKFPTPEIRLAINFHLVFSHEHLNSGKCEMVKGLEPVLIASDVKRETQSLLFALAGRKSKTEGTKKVPGWV